MSAIGRALVSGGNGLPEKSPSVVATRERWLEAQKFELGVWSRRHSWYRRSLARCGEWLGLRTTSVYDDWNAWWRQHFQEYQLIPTTLNNVIELGCGPYTNLRLILENRAANHIVCSDPLARHYIKLPGCWLSEQYDRGAIVVDDHPIEECPFGDDYFDLVVLINVLDHVQDAWQCLDTAIRITKPGGQLVIGQDLTDSEDVSRSTEDVGHPIRLHHSDIDAHLDARIRRQFYKVLPRHDGRNPAAHYGTYLLIGQK
jgi:SAM-dependent methyltransferase